MNGIVDNDILHSCTSKDVPLLTAKIRNTYYDRNFPVVKPIEYTIDGAKHSTMYVPILTMLQELRKKKNV